MLKAIPNGYNSGWRLWEGTTNVGPDFSSMEEATYWALANGYKLTYEDL